MKDWGYLQLAAKGNTVAVLTHQPVTRESVIILLHIIPLLMECVILPPPPSSFMSPTAQFPDAATKKKDIFPLFYLC